ncbi:Aste57867_1459 [Aphanomyces stellatus]|uniref:Aste57867_1459 protein n=1 Tax=Aphanomyces stellatus TaxID=120398 RepID=A0A485K6B5_9STRA|nr:hypothetical protein As57867_001458 [Aphanomyces stellatus]VFT78676.1 Aste57867_1459 [Aphanomyces stellatus]
MRRRDPAGVPSVRGKKRETCRRKYPNADLNFISYENPPLLFAWYSPCDTETSATRSVSRTNDERRSKETQEDEAKKHVTKVRMTAATQTEKAVNAACASTKSVQQTTNSAVRDQATQASGIFEEGTNQRTHMIETTPKPRFESRTETDEDTLLHKDKGTFMSAISNRSKLPVKQDISDNEPTNNEPIRSLTTPLLKPQPKISSKGMHRNKDNDETSVVYPTANATSKHDKHSSHAGGQTQKEMKAYWKWLHWYSSWQLYYTEKATGVEPRTHGKATSVPELQQGPSKPPKEAASWWVDVASASFIESDCGPQRTKHPAMLPRGAVSLPIQLERTTRMRRASCASSDHQVEAAIAPLQRASLPTKTIKGIDKYTDFKPDEELTLAELAG